MIEAFDIKRSVSMTDAVERFRISASYIIGFRVRFMAAGTTICGSTRTHFTALCVTNRAIQFDLCRSCSDLTSKKRCEKSMRTFRSDYPMQNRPTQSVEKRCENGSAEQRREPFRNTMLGFVRTANRRF